MVRVIIERRLKEENEGEVRELLYDLRVKAMRQPGYVSGETLMGYDDPLLYSVVSTWRSAEEWQAWANNAERQAIETRVERLLSAPAKTTIFLLKQPY